MALADVEIQQALDLDRLIAKAVEIAQLSDFGPYDFKEPLTKLLE